MDDVRVLLVDDQSDFLAAMDAVVDEAAGFVVVGRAVTGEECLELTLRLAPDLVLLDVNLPGMDGVEAARQLLAGQEPPVVFLLSTYDEDVGERFLLESGASAYLAKFLLAPDVLVRTWGQHGPQSRGAR